MIAVIAHTHPSITSGGAEISAYTLFKGLQAIGVPTLFVALCPEDQMHKAEALDPHEHLIGYDPATYDPLYHLAEPQVIQQLLRLLGSSGCKQVVLHHFLYLGINGVRTLAEDPRWRVSLVLHEFLAICAHHGQMITRPALRLCQSASPVSCAKCLPEHAPEQLAARTELLQATLSQVDQVISPSAFLKGRFVAWGLPAERIHVIENGVPQLPPPETSACASDKGTARSPVVLGFFGQINPFKGVDLILDALEQLALNEDAVAGLRVRIHGPLVGLPPEFAQRLQQLASELPCLEVRGAYRNDDVFELMRECDFVLMASKWWENSPVVIQEAYACGRPMIVPGIGGMAEKVRDGVTGLHFRAGDARALADTMRRACEPGVAQRLRQELPAVSTGQDMARAYLEVLG